MPGPSPNESDSLLMKTQAPVLKAGGLWTDLCYLTNLQRRLHGSGLQTPGAYLLSHCLWQESPFQAHMGTGVGRGAMGAHCLQASCVLVLGGLLETHHRLWSLPGRDHVLRGIPLCSAPFSPALLINGAAVDCNMTGVKPSGYLLFFVFSHSRYWLGRTLVSKARMVGGLEPHI